MWPVYEDVKDIVGDLTETGETFEKSDPEQGGNTEGVTEKSDLITSTPEREAVFECPDGDQDEPVMNSDSNIENLDGNSDSHNAAEAVDFSKTVSNGSTGNKAKSNEVVPENSVKSNEREMSWERKQAQLLMRQVNKRFTMQAYVNTEEDDNLDYLFEDDNKEVAESIYSSISTMRSSPVPNTQLNEEGNTNTNQYPSRSVSHEFQSSSFVDEQDSGVMYQSLPFSNYRERVAESEEAKKIAKLSREACASHLKAICEDIHHYLGE